MTAALVAYAFCWLMAFAFVIVGAWWSMDRRRPERPSGRPHHVREQARR